MPVNKKNTINYQNQYYVDPYSSQSNCVDPINNGFQNPNFLKTNHTN